MEVTSAKHLYTFQEKKKKKLKTGCSLTVDHKRVTILAEKIFLFYFFL